MPATDFSTKIVPSEIIDAMKRSDCPSSERHRFLNHHFSRWNRRPRELAIAAVVAALAIVTIQGQDDAGKPAPGNDQGAPPPPGDVKPAAPPAEKSALPSEDFGAPAKAPAPGVSSELVGQPKPGEESFAPSGKPGASEPATEPAKPAVTFANASEAHIRFLDLLESEQRFPSAAACAQCHPDQYREWSVSAHGYAQLSPVFNTMQAKILKASAGTNGDFCVRCHTQIGMQREEPLFTSNLKRHPASIEGITCIICHRVDRNYGKVSGRTAIVEGKIYDPVYGPKGNAILKETIAGNANLKTSDSAEGQLKIHADVVKFDPITTSGFCGTCHDVNLLNGFRLEEAFTQFKNSPAAHRGESCQDCHMGKVPGKKTADGDANFAFASAARIGGAVWAKEGDPDYGAPTKPRKRTNHMFVGPDYSIIHPGIFPHSKAVRDLLWDMQKQVTKEDGTIEVLERGGLKHVLDFKWEDGWGDATSAFEKRMVDDPKKEDALPWPWNDRKYRSDFRLLLNDQFHNLDIISEQRQQILRRGIQLGEFIVTKDDAGGLRFKIHVRNGTDGHGVPTGFDAERLMVLQVTVRDARGHILHQSGDRDPNGDVRDTHSAFVHHDAEKTASWLHAADWKKSAGLPLLPEDLKWKQDDELLNLQSIFLVRTLRGGEREQILPTNLLIDPLPYVRPDTRPGILYARPATARKQAGVMPPNGGRWGEYEVPAKALTGLRPYTVQIKFIAQMVPINLVKFISNVGFDYNLSPMEIGKRVAFGHRVSPSQRDEDRRGGALTVWDRKVVLDGSRTSWDLSPSEREIMATGTVPFPYDPKFEEKQGESAGGIIAPLPEKPGEVSPVPLVPLPSDKSAQEPALPQSEKPAPPPEDFGAPAKPKP
jgi:hypothetical protein